MSRTRTRKRTTPTPTVTRPEPHLRPVPPTGTRPAINLDKPRPALPHRHDDYMPLAAIRAHLAARITGLPVPARITDWIVGPNGEATWHRGPDGTLTHTPTSPAPFHAVLACTHNTHTHPIVDGPSLLQAQTATWACTSDHDAHRHPEAARRAQALGNAIHRSASAAADTVQTDVHTLRDTHAADHDTAKEHPADD